ncbi:hypothetical protein [Bradyrhizobium altum]|nr:hypothetical protein [Bradyrhizobium altum]
MEVEPTVGWAFLDPEKALRQLLVSQAAYPGWLRILDVIGDEI